MSDQSFADVALKPVTTEAAALVAQWLSDPAINQWLFGDFRSKRFSPRQVLLLASSPRNEFWTIECGGTPCGIVAMSQIDRHDKSANIWYFVGDARYLGRGVATRALRLAVDAAFERGFESLNASVMAPNVASRRVLERGGFLSVGVLRRGVRLGDEFVDRLLYDLIRADTLAKPDSGTVTGDTWTE